MQKPGLMVPSFDVLQTALRENKRKFKYLPTGLPCCSNSKETACDARDQGLIPELGSSSGEGNGNPIQYSRLENSMDKEARQATVCDMIEQLTHTHILGVVLNSFQIENVG